MRLRGSMVAIVTPMKDGEVDLAAYRDLVAWQVAEGTQAIVPCGTTGESATLTEAESAAVIRATVEEARGRVPVIAGAGANATHACIAAVRRAKELGADAALVVTPYYNKPTQEGLFRHYEAVWKAVGFPVVAYNVPSRTACDLSPETVARLAAAGCIVGLKDATASMDRQLQLVEKVGPDALAWLSGDDFTALPYLACGGHGVISVVANVAPRLVRGLVDAALARDLDAALRAQVLLAELNRALFVETSPGPVKAAVSLLGRCTPELRLPLAPVADASLARVREAMTKLELLPTPHA